MRLKWSNNTHFHLFWLYSGAYLKLCFFPCCLSSFAAELSCPTQSSNTWLVQVSKLVSLLPFCLTFKYISSSLDIVLTVLHSHVGPNILLAHSTSLKQTGSMLPPVLNTTSAETQPACLTNTFKALANFFSQGFVNLLKFRSACWQILQLGK